MIPKRNKAFYRPNVAMVILNGDNRVFWARRKNLDAWQFPQGGIKRHETPIQAMRRELREETGLDPSQVEVLATSRGWIRYQIPEHMRRSENFVGQRQKWFLLRLLGSDSSVRLDAGPEPREFDEWRWETPSLVLAQVIDFKRDAYARALSEFADFIGVEPPSA